MVQPEVQIQHPFDGFGEAVLRCRLEDVIHGILIIRGDEDHHRIGLDLLQDFEARGAGHPDIEKDKVRLLTVDRLDGLQPVPRLTSVNISLESH